MLVTAIAVRELCSKTKVLLFSGHAATIDILSMAKAEGHDFDFLQKPVNPDRLLKMLQTWTDKKALCRPVHQAELI